MNLNALQIGFIGVFGLLGVGLYGLLTTRNLIKVVIGLQILVKATLLGLILAGKLSGQLILSQSLALTVIVADTVVAVIGLALAVQIKRQVGSLDTLAIAKLRG